MKDSRNVKPIAAMNKRLTKEQMRKLLLSAKKKADKMPEEEGSFRLEVICKKTDIDKK